MSKKNTIQPQNLVYNSIYNTKYLQNIKFTVKANRNRCSKDMI